MPMCFIHVARKLHSLHSYFITEKLHHMTPPLVFFIACSLVTPALSGSYCSTWWRHQMETFSALLTLCARNSRDTGEFPAQRPVRQSFDVFFDPRLTKPLNKQSWGWCFVTPSPSLWRHSYKTAACMDCTHSVVLFHFILLIPGAPFTKMV